MPEAPELPRRLRASLQGVTLLRRRPPWVAIGLIACNCAVFLALQPRLQGAWRLWQQDLYLGLQFQSASVAGGQWYRLATAMFLHVTLDHLQGTMLTLLIVGPVLELLAGRTWFLLTYLMSGIGAEAASFAFEPCHGGSGASAAVLGAFGATWVWVLPRAGARGTLVDRYGAAAAMPLLLLTLMPTFSGNAGTDALAHWWGLGTGVALGAASRTWGRRPRLAVPVVVAAAGLSAVLVAWRSWNCRCV